MILTGIDSKSMSRNLNYVLLLILFFIGISGKNFSQGINNFDQFVEYKYRINQLISKTKTGKSFFFKSSNDYLMCSPDTSTIKKSLDSLIKIRPEDVPLSSKLDISLEHLINISNSNFNDWNNSSLLQLHGSQNLSRVRLNYKSSNLVISFSPEFLVIHPFAKSSRDIANPNNISSSKYFILPGQSSIYFTRNKLAIGLSSENIWWGPAYHNSLVISNNAPGFPHVSLKTIQPLNIGIGKLEFQLISGILKSNKGLPFDNFLDSNINPKALGDRYFNGIVFSFQPKFLPGFYFGLSRAMQFYFDNLNRFHGSFFSKYIPVITTSLQRQNALNDDALVRDQLGSFYFKYQAPKQKVEFYLEYGYNDYFLNFRDFALNSTHSAAYVLGVRKIINKSDLTFELLKMSPIAGQSDRPGNNAWYWHFQIAEGMTNMNQILAAAPSLGVSSMNISIIPDIEKRNFSLKFFRLERNPFYQKVLWIDNGLLFDWIKSYKKASFSLTLSSMYSQNIRWINANNKISFLVRLGYRYKLL